MSEIVIGTMLLRDCLKLYVCLEQYYVRVVSGKLWACSIKFYNYLSNFLILVFKVCAVTILWLGPYIGCQIFSLAEVGSHNPDMTEINYFVAPALGLCILLYIATLSYICLPHSIGMVGIWVVSVVVCLSGHWFAYFLAEKHRTGPRSYQAGNAPINENFRYQHGLSGQGTRCRWAWENGVGDGLQKEADVTHHVTQFWRENQIF